MASTRSTIVIVLVVTAIVSAVLCFLLCNLDHCRLHRVNANPFTVIMPPIITSPPRVLPEIHSSLVVELLPLFSVTSRSSTLATNYAVCLSEFHNNDLLRILPLCCHAFHADCIDTWLHSNLSCPLCRSPIFTSIFNLVNIPQSPSWNSFRIEIGSVSIQETNPDVTPLVLRRVEGPLFVKKFASPVESNATALADVSGSRRN